MTVHVDDGRAFLERTDDEVRPHAVRPARLADPRHRAVGSCGWRTTCSPSEALDRARAPPRPGGIVRDVQLLPRAVAASTARRHRRTGLRPPRPASTAHRRPVAGGHHGRHDADNAVCAEGASGTTAVAAAGQRASRRRSTTGRSSTSRTRTIPSLYLWMLALILRVSLVAGPRRRRAVPHDAPLRRPVLHGRGVPAAGDQERSRQFALLFGTTWLVNALVFAGVLLACWPRSR